MSRVGVFVDDVGRRDVDADLSGCASSREILVS